MAVAASSTFDVFTAPFWLLIYSPVLVLALIGLVFWGFDHHRKCQRQEAAKRLRELRQQREQADRSTAKLWQDDAEPLHCVQVTDAYGQPVALTPFGYQRRNMWPDSAADPLGIDTADVWRDRTS